MHLRYALLLAAGRGRFSLVEQVFDSLGSLDRTMSHTPMSDLATDQQLATIARTAPSRALLDRLFDELMSGSVDAEEQEREAAAGCTATRSRRPTTT